MPRSFHLLLYVLLFLDASWKLGCSRRASMFHRSSAAQLHACIHGKWRKKISTKTRHPRIIRYFHHFPWNVSTRTAQKLARCRDDKKQSRAPRLAHFLAVANVKRRRPSFASRRIPKHASNPTAYVCFECYSSYSDGSQLVENRKFISLIQHHPGFLDSGYDQGYIIGFVNIDPSFDPRSPLPRIYEQCASLGARDCLLSSRRPA